METIVRALNPGWVGSAIGLLSLLVAFMLYRASRTTARPAYQRAGLALIGSERASLPAEVEVRFRGLPVERLTKSYVVFWNDGKATLRGSDIVGDDPIRCEVSEDARMLEVRLVTCTRPVNKFAAAIDPKASNCALITFDYLDPQDGAAIEILHTASNRYPAIKGTIRGVPKGLLSRGRILSANHVGQNQASLLRRVFSVLPWLSIFAGVVAVTVAVLLPEKYLVSASHADTQTSIPRSVIAIVGVLYALPGLLLWWMTHRRYPAALHTPELDQ